MILTYADLSEEDKEIIIGCFIVMEEFYTRQLTKQISHIMAIDMDSEKCIIMKNRGLNIKMVLPY
jgi:hypothetical protein